MHIQRYPGLSPGFPFYSQRLGNREASLRFLQPRINFAIRNSSAHTCRHPRCEAKPPFLIKCSRHGSSPDASFSPFSPHPRLPTFAFSYASLSVFTSIDRQRHRRLIYVVNSEVGRQPQAETGFSISRLNSAGSRNI